LFSLQSLEFDIHTKWSLNVACVELKSLNIEVHEREMCVGRGGIFGELWAKKTKKPKNRLNWENQKKITKKPNREKKSIKILKKPTDSVRFRFYKPKTEKTEPNPNRKKPEKKPSQTEKTEPNWKNQTKPVFVQKNRT